ncbi:MAG: DUF1684 domain-containing protein [Candidatus Korobacteraceae bacterium]
MNLRHRSLLVAASVLFITAAAFAADTQPPADWQKDLLAWHSERAKNLQAPYGWLSLVGLDWLKPGDNSVGSAADNALKLKSQAVPHLGVVRLGSNSIELLPPAGGYPKELRVDGKAPANPQPLAADDQPKPSKITFATLQVTVIHRGDQYGLRIKDSQSPTRVGFHGLKWYPPDPALRVKAEWTPYNPPLKRKVPTVLGTEIEADVPGKVTFTLNGQSLSLEPILEDPGDKELFFIIKDTTTQDKSYGAGRFLYTPFPSHGLTQPGELWLDFNRLENPPCAYTPYATCPLAPPQNRLQVALPAGEQRYHD